jgi:hypothetical protein
MQKYLIERNVPGAHEMSPEELRSAAGKSCEVLRDLGTGIQWQQSFVTEDKITCVYLANNEEIIREHARISGFPANAIHEVKGMMDPTTGAPRQAAAAAS